MLLTLLVAQSCPTLCNPMDCRVPGCFVLEIAQARILEWVFLPLGDLLDPGIELTSFAPLALAGCSSPLSHGGY